MKYGTVIKKSAAILIAVLTAACMASCSVDDKLPEKAGDIISIDENGIITVKDNNNKTYLYKAISENNEPDERINVKSFGATGDGKTDDTVAFSAAIAVLKNGGTLYIPEGKYLITAPIIIPGSTTVCGTGANAVIVYKREQSQTDLKSDISCFLIKDGADSVTIKNLAIKYEGNFFGEAGQSYSGKISGIYAGAVSDLYISNVAISGFNSCGIDLSGGNSGEKALRITVENSYLHHNRNAGLMMSNVYGVLITANTMEYNGCEADGKVGCGCAADRAANTENVLVISNSINYNYCRGIDVNAGAKILIDGNTCKANRLCGIYAEGKNTTDVVITNNIISDMNYTKTIPQGYGSVTGISFGAADEEDTSLYQNFTVSNNVIRNISVGSAETAIPLYCFASNKKGNIKITENTIDCDVIDSIFSINRDSKIEDHELNVVFSDNQITVKSLKSNGLLLIFKKLIFDGNQIKIIKTSDTVSVNILSGAANGEMIYCNNIISTDKSSVNEYALNSESGMAAIVMKNNIYNGVIAN